MNRFSRINTVENGLLRVFYQAEVSSTIRIVSADSIIADNLGTLHPDAVPFLFPSRYAQSDRIREHAQEMFGHLTTPYAIASAVSY